MNRWTGITLNAPAIVMAGIIKIDKYIGSLSEQKCSNANWLMIKPVFLQDQNFWGSLMTPCLKIWGSLANLVGQNFFNV